MVSHALCRVRKLARNDVDSAQRRIFSHFIRTDGKFVDLLYTLPPNGEKLHCWNTVLGA